MLSSPLNQACRSRSNKWPTQPFRNFRKPHPSQAPSRWRPFRTALQFASPWPRSPMYLGVPRDLRGRVRLDPPGRKGLPVRRALRAARQGRLEAVLLGQLARAAVRVPRVPPGPPVRLALEVPRDRPEPVRRDPLARARQAPRVLEDPQGRRAGQRDLPVRVRPARPAQTALQALQAAPRVRPAQAVLLGPLAQRGPLATAVAQAPQVPRAPVRRVRLGPLGLAEQPESVVRRVQPVPMRHRTGRSRPPVPIYPVARR
jgi:hypothetical protein